MSDATNTHYVVAKEIDGELWVKHAWHYHSINKLQAKLDKVVEYIKDCSVSHYETRYKYRAQVLLKEIGGDDE